MARKDKDTREVEYRFSVALETDSDIRDALRLEAKRLGVPRVTLRDFATRALTKAAREALAPAHEERTGR
jgi:hypothetical protein